jgi:hypothetical protein
VRGTWCVTTYAGYCWGITMESANGRSKYATVLTTDNLGNGEIAFSSLAGTAASGSDIAAGEFAWWNTDGSFQIGTGSHPVKGDSSGNVDANGYKAQGTAGVSCSGTPTSSFASVNGIVTHC